MSGISLETADFVARDEFIAEKSAPPVPFWTDVKIQRIWLAVAASLCAIGAIVLGVLSFSVSPWFAAGAIPLALATGTFIWYACHIIDYDNPKELARVQDKAAKMSLEKIVKAHGWDKLFQYAIVRPEQFNQLYIQHVQGMSLTRLMDDYEETKGKLNEAIRKAPNSKAREFEIPEVKFWKGLLVQETRGLQYSELTKNYSLERLVGYSLISPEELKQSFIRFADGAPLNSVIAEYEKCLTATAGSPGYSLPQPIQWKDKLAQETGHFAYVELTKNFSLAKLVQYSLIEPEVLSRSFAAFAETATLNRIISEYEKSSSAVCTDNRYVLPEPRQWVGKLAAETRGLQYSLLASGYSLPKLIQYSLIQPQELSESFTRFAAEASLVKIIEAYENTTRQIAPYSGFSLPSPGQWKEKFVQETADQKATRIAEIYPINSLLNYSIFGRDEHRILSQAIEARSQYSSFKGQCEQEFARIKEVEGRACQQTKEVAERTYLSNVAHDQLRNLNSQYLEGVKALESKALQQIQTERDHLANYESIVPPLENIEALRNQCADKCSQIQRELDRQKNNLYSDYYQTDIALRGAIQEAAYLKEESFRLADRQYVAAVDSARKSADNQIALHENALARRLDEIDAEYDRFREAQK